jgi:hypothetical protein
LNSCEQLHRRNAENNFNAEDAEERRDAEDYIQKESPSRRAPGFFITAAREASRGFPSGRPKKKNRVRGGPTRLGVPSSASLPLCVLCVKAVAVRNWCLTRILLSFRLIPSQSCQILSHPVPKKSSHWIRYIGQVRREPAHTGIDSFRQIRAIRG